MQYIELVPGGKLLDDAYVQNYKEASVQYAHVGKLMVNSVDMLTLTTQASQAIF